MAYLADLQEALRKLPEPSLQTKYTILYTGSFSPVTSAHVEAVIKTANLIKEDNRAITNENLQIVIVPASDKYNKPSLNSGNNDYLSEEARKFFLEMAFNGVPGLQGISVIISDIEFFYKGLNPGDAVPTDMTCKFLKKLGIIAPEKEKTFYVMGADNIEEGLIGWSNPSSLMDEVTIVVVSRGLPILYPEADYLPVLMNGEGPILKYEELSADQKQTVKQITPLANRYISVYYTPNPDFTRNSIRKVLWSDVQANRPAIWDAIKNLRRVSFSVPEISSTLLRSIVQNLPISKADLKKVFDQLQIPYDDFEAYFNNNSVIPEKKNEVISFLTPIDPDLLASTYGNKGIILVGGYRAKNRKKGSKRGRRSQKKRSKRGRRSQKKRSKRRRRSQKK